MAAERKILLAEVLTSVSCDVTAAHCARPIFSHAKCNKSLYEFKYWTKTKREKNASTQKKKKKKKALRAKNERMWKNIYFKSKDGVATTVVVAAAAKRGQRTA